MEKINLLDQSIAIVIVLFILSLISERFITWFKLYFFKKGNTLFWIFFNWDKDYSKKTKDPAFEKDREQRILLLNISLSIIISFLAHADIFKILTAENPYQALGWKSICWNWNWNNLQTFIGCILGGLFISLGSKFWHDTLGLLLYSKNLKEKLNDNATFEIDKIQQLDEWLQVTQGDVVRKVFTENKDMLKNLKNVIGCGITCDENNNKCIEVVTNDSDTHLIPRSLPYSLPNGNAKEVKVVVRVSTGIETHLKLADDITNKDFPDSYGSAGLVVCYKNAQKKPMLLTCYHVAIGSAHDYDRFLFNGHEDIVNPHGDSGVKIGEIRAALLNNEIDVALIDLDVPLKNETDNGPISGIREIKYEEQYNQVKVNIKGYKSRQTGFVTSTHNYASIRYNLPDGNTVQKDLYNLIAINSDNEKPFSQKGDSGSAVLDAGNKVIGILVAGDQQTSYAIPIQTIFNQLNLQLI